MFFTQFKQCVRAVYCEDVIGPEQGSLGLICAGEVTDAMIRRRVDLPEADQQLTGLSIGREERIVASLASGVFGKQRGRQINGGAVGKCLRHRGQIERRGWFNGNQTELLHKEALRRHDIQAVVAERGERKLADRLRLHGGFRRGFRGRLRCGFRSRFRRRLWCGFRGRFRRGRGRGFRRRRGCGSRRRVRRWNGRRLCALLRFRVPGIGAQQLARLAVYADIQAAVLAEGFFRVINIFENRLPIFVQLHGFASVLVFFDHGLLQIKGQFGFAVIGEGGGRDQPARLQQHGGAEQGAEDGFGFSHHEITSHGNGKCDPSLCSHYTESPIEIQASAPLRMIKITK